ncbi:RNA polymerase sigma factor [Streptomyces sp. WMMC940]|uniref:RNA polymerase sigma factor n=1 Tax=Streptomyces sp. WMMC940 TaxID=3015153 RepID=UPI0022B71A85|nr:sigma-70 family RNA polymerase sigma factor [Streptomyces sp. WMMC940]MCZ7456096.1 sigma-70 family RNA polymerase sigma factor [Streptomyces sp. WMMC940]
MSGSDKKERRIPHPRGTREAVHPPEALCPEAQRQWDLMHQLAPSVRKLIYTLTGSRETVDEVEARVWEAIFVRFKNSGPLDDGRFGKLKSYLWAVVREKSHSYLKELRKRAEDFVGDDLYLLENQEVHPSAEAEALVDLAPAMRVLADELSDLQLKVFVLSEAYDLKAPVIAELLGGTVTNASVRDALRHARAKLRSHRVGVRLGVLAEE